MSRLIDAVRRAREGGTLPEQFRAAGVRDACPGWAIHTYGVLLARHRLGNPGGYTVYFLQHDDGSYSFIG